MSDTIPIVELPCKALIQYWYSATSRATATAQALRLKHKFRRRRFAVLKWDNGMFQPVELKGR